MISEKVTSTSAMATLKARTVTTTMTVLFRFSVKGVLTAETAVFVHFESVGVVLLVFLCVIIALFALSASQCHFDSHFFGTS